MKIYPNLLAASSLLAILNPSAVRAADGILSFELAPPQWAETAAAPEAVVTVAAPDPANQPLPIPTRAAHPPMRYHSPQQLPAGVYRRGVAVALNDSSAAALLPPAPPLPEPAIMVAAVSPDPQPASEPEAKAESEWLALDFAVEPSAAVVAMTEAKLAASQPKADPLPTLFEGNSDSLVARAVGSAEGTRTPSGAINSAYFGHTDPGNRVWNMGTFSYQHGAKTPEEADQKQLVRLQNQGDVLRRRAVQHGLNLTLEETLNGLDLANQSPLAAIGRVGYIERLAEAKANGFEGSEAILVARTRSYINPNTGRWNAPGLGNTEVSIRRDQQRRAKAVAQAIAAYEAQNPQLKAQAWTLTPSPAPETLVAGADTPAELADDFLQRWTSSSDPVAQAEPANDSSLVGQAPAAVTQNEHAPDLSAADLATDRGLASLWQLTVGKLSTLGQDDQGESMPQAASLTGVLFNSTASEAEPQAATPAPTASDTPAGAEPAAIAPPSWSEVREGNQTYSVPSVNHGGIAGAFPESTVYVPEAPAEPIVAASSLAEAAEAEPAAEPELQAPAGDSDQTVSGADLPTLAVEPAESVQGAQAPEPDATLLLPAAGEPSQADPEPAIKDGLNFDKVDAVQGLPPDLLQREFSEANSAESVNETGNGHLKY
ncbi:MAG: hypothetical protein WBA99_04615 [Nodosilinea sp.]